MKYLLPLLALCACGPTAEPVCVTECGVRVMNADCAQVQDLEDRAVPAIEKRWTPRDARSVCERLEGWSLVVIDTHGTGRWNSYGVDVAGLCYCWGTINTTETLAAYTHEVIHALDCPAENQAHAGWDAWQWAAIEEAQPR